MLPGSSQRKHLTTDVKQVYGLKYSRLTAVQLMRRMTGDPWTRVVTVLGAGTVTLLALAEEYAALPGAVAGFGAALAIGAYDRARR